MWRFREDRRIFSGLGSVDCARCSYDELAFGTYGVRSLGRGSIFYVGAPTKDFRVAGKSFCGSFPGIVRAGDCERRKICDCAGAPRGTGGCLFRQGRAGGVNLGSGRAAPSLINSGVQEGVGRVNRL